MRHAPILLKIGRGCHWIITALTRAATSPGLLAGPAARRLTRFGRRGCAGSGRERRSSSTVRLTLGGAIWQASLRLSRMTSGHIMIRNRRRAPNVVEVGVLSSVAWTGLHRLLRALLWRDSPLLASLQVVGAPAPPRVVGAAVMPAVHEFEDAALERLPRLRLPLRGQHRPMVAWRSRRPLSQQGAVYLALAAADLPLVFHVGFLAMPRRLRLLGLLEVGVDAATPPGVPSLQVALPLAAWRLVHSAVSDAHGRGTWKRVWRPWLAPNADVFVGLARNVFVTLLDVLQARGRLRLRERLCRGDLAGRRGKVCKRGVARLASCRLRRLCSLGAARPPRRRTADVTAVWCRLRARRANAVATVILRLLRQCNVQGFAELLDLAVFF
mmetsp:Transcript_72298/g.200556  ORF Transcript_72298/g.200556 Transcript_72298/m.200556 type:complete len:384 (+) Transcript_72298:622-1773(+)